MTAFIVCSRLESSRVPGKPLIKYCGETSIEHLCKRLLVTGIPVYVAVPPTQLANYAFLLDRFKNLFLVSGAADDPLKRMSDIAEAHGIKNVIRVTHDKIFVNTDSIPNALKHFVNHRLDYLYSSDFVDGTGYEIISARALKLASDKFKRVEHVSYAIKAVTDKKFNFRSIGFVPRDIRLLIDYEADVRVMNVILSTLGPDCTTKEVIYFMSRNRFLKEMNRMPVVTFYTCAYNAEKWIDEAMESVSMQSVFKASEYLVIDDYSTDKTLFNIARFASGKPNVRFFKNRMNLGLSSSSNFALKNARGRYIIRLDADDYFIDPNIVEKMISTLNEQGLDVVYPNCFKGLSKKTIQSGKECHHVGGSLFLTSAINHVKFTDNLRNHDSLDVFLRSQPFLRVGYYERPAFVYRQHNKSMSKTNLDERAKVRTFLESEYGPNN